MGNSSRVYNLQWMSKKLFAKLQNPFAPSAPPLEDVTYTVGQRRRRRRSDHSAPRTHTNDNKRSNQDIKIWDFWSNIPNNITVVEGRRQGREQKWNIVVEATTLVKVESRKSLQRLQGRDGTQLIIPQIVIQVLEYLKPQSTLTNIAGVRSALEWIEDCKKRSSWWMKIYGDDSEGVQIECMHPTKSLDHVLNCALNYKRNNITNAEHLVILTGHFSLKKKAILEGIICERAQDFTRILLCSNGIS